VTIDTIERSEYDGNPVEIYTLVRQTNIWRYTSADADQTVDGFLYESYPISRDKIAQSQEVARGPINLKMSKSLPFLFPYRSSPPSSVTTISIRRFHQGLAEYVTVWLGRITNVKFGERDAEVRCEPVFTSLKRPALRRRYQTTCPHVLYGAQCSVERAEFAVAATLIGSTGTVLTSPTFALTEDGWFAGGYVDWTTDDGDVERRFIVDHVGEDITINLPFQGLVGTDEVVAYPGCDHLIATCHDKFDNEDNYGGQPFYPDKNPMNGTPIF